MKDEIELTDDQEKLILDIFNGCDDSTPPSLKMIVEKCWPELKDKNIDGRSMHGKAIKKFLASRQLKARAAHEYDRKTDALALTEKQKAFISDMASKMRPLEITKNLFDNNSLRPLSAEFKVVNEYYRSLDPKLRMIQDDAPKKDYRPPKTNEQAINRVNKYVLEGIRPEGLTKRQIAWMKSLIRFMHTHRFLLSITDLEDDSERELFESSFVRFVYDKPDLTEEEIDLYLNLCGDIINLRRVDKEISSISHMIEDLREEDRKISGAMVEQIGKLYSERDSNMRRQKNTLEDLNGKRAKRLESQQRENASVLTLVELWRDKSHRDKIIALADERKQKLGQEKDRVKGIDALKMEVFGLTEEEAMDIASAPAEKKEAI